MTPDRTGAFEGEGVTGAALEPLLLVGAGRLGVALAFHLHQAGLRKITLFNRSRRPHLEGRWPGISLVLGEPVSALEGVEQPSLILLTVSDQALPHVALELSRSSTLPRSVPVLHCSGALPVTVLEPLAARGMPTGSCHPLKSFSGEPVPGDLLGIPLALEGHPAAVASGEALALVLSMKSFRLRQEGRAAYHAGAVMASNLLVALASFAAEVLSSSLELPDRSTALALLMPLIEGTVENLSRNGLPSALTGPVSRGDALVVEAHRRYLAQEAMAERLEPSVEAVYQLLSQKALELAREQGLPSAEQERLQNVLAASFRPVERNV